jgi:hypothetical protein
MDENQIPGCWKYFLFYIYYSTDSGALSYPRFVSSPTFGAFADRVSLKASCPFLSVKIPVDNMWCIFNGYWHGVKDLHDIETAVTFNYSSKDGIETWDLRACKIII